MRPPTRTVAENPAHLVVGLVTARFRGPRGFALLADSVHVATRVGSTYALAGFSRSQDRIAVTARGPQPRRYPSTAAAVIALHDSTPA